MQSKPVMILSLLLGTLVVAGCSKQEPAQAGGAVEAASTEAAAAPAAAPHALACDMVTAAEMSVILGTTVQAMAGSNERPPSATECRYQTGEPSPSEDAMAQGAVEPIYAEVEVDWGGGDQETLGTAADLVNGASTLDAADPLKGLGDRAYKVTNDQVFISTKGDLMMIRFSRRSGDVAARARKIFETAQPRM